MNFANGPSENVESDLGVEPWSCSVLTPQTSEVLLVDINHFLNYLKRICSFILDSSLNSIDIDRLFVDDISYDSVQRFISGDRCQALLISKKNLATEYSSSSPLFIVYAISNEGDQINFNSLSFILLKRNRTIINDKSYHEQLRVIVLIDLNQQKVLFGASLDRSRIDLPEIILTTGMIADQTIKQLISIIIPTSTNNENKNQNEYHEDDSEDEEDDDTMIFRFSFTGGLSNDDRARVYDAIITFSVRTGVQNRCNTPCHVRRTADPNFIFAPYEEFSVVFHTQASFISFQAWLSREYGGYQHVLTIIEPAAFAMNIIV